MKNNLFKIAVGALILKGDKVLLHHRRDYDMWDLPSGGMEAGETIPEALIREVKEETGLKVKLLRLVGVYHNYRRNVIIFLFLVKVLAGKLTVNQEADKFGYFHYRKLPDNLVPKHKERILNFFHDRKTVAVKTQKGGEGAVVLGLKK